MALHWLVVPLPRPPLEPLLSVALMPTLVHCALGGSVKGGRPHLRQEGAGVEALGCLLCARLASCTSRGVRVTWDLNPSERQPSFRRVSCRALQESWWRELQVLPSRTHPQMATTGTGGYLLSGIKVLQASAGTAREPPAKKPRN